MILTKARLTDEEFQEAMIFSPLMTSERATLAYRMLVLGESATALAREKGCSVTAVRLAAQIIVSRWKARRIAHRSSTIANAGKTPPDDPLWHKNRRIR